MLSELFGLFRFWIKAERVVLEGKRKRGGGEGKKKQKSGRIENRTEANETWVGARGKAKAMIRSSAFSAVWLRASLSKN